MDGFRSLLYVERCAGGTGSGLQAARELAGAHGARLTVGGVAPGAVPVGESVAAGAAERRQASIVRWRRRLEGLLEGGSESVEVRVLRGGLCEAVAEEVERGGHDLVLKAAVAAGTWSPWGPDAADRRLLHCSPCPVWLVNPVHGGGVRVVLVAVSGSGGSSAVSDRGLVRLAARVARASDAELALVHGWSLVGESILASRLRGVSRHRLRKLRIRTLRERRRRLEALVAREAPELDVSLWLPHASPVRAIRWAARRASADVVVVGNRGRRGLEALFLGNVADRLVGRVPASVLSVGTGAALPARGPLLRRAVAAVAGAGALI